MYYKTNEKKPSYKSDRGVTQQHNHGIVHLATLAFCRLLLTLYLPLYTAASRDYPITVA